MASRRRARPALWTLLTAPVSAQPRSPPRFYTARIDLGPDGIHNVPGIGNDVPGPAN